MASDTFRWKIRGMLTVPYGPTFDRPEVVLASVFDAQAAELAEARERAEYWKQRAKSAEGHLWANDCRAAARELHRLTAASETPYEELSDSQRIQIESAVVRVIGAVNACRDARKPAECSEAEALRQIHPAK